MESTSVSRKFFFYIMAMVVLLASCSRTRPRVLVFTKTEAYRHESIEAGIAAFRTLAEDKRFEVTFTEDPDYFVEDSLSQYRAVVFLNTTGDVLNDAGQEAFERFIQAGGGYLGIHSAADTEYDWPWYGGLTGGYFLDHPDTPGNVQSGTFAVANPGHWATEGMPDTFDREDEFYNFRNLSSNIQVVLTLDETTYQGGKHGDDHPMSWYQRYDGGRSFYTAMGHTIESYSEPMFLSHVWAGLRYVMGGDDPQPMDYSRSRPEENRFTKVVLAENLDEPMELIALDDKRILFIQRKGEVRLFHAETGDIKTIARIPVSTLYDKDENGDQRTAEDGLMGLTRDPNFAENQWIYLYYSATKDTANVLSRFEMSGDELLLESEKQILKVPVQRKQCCHTGGSMAWDSQGNLYLSTGDNTNPWFSEGYSPSDERPGNSPWDAQKSSSNTNDLRGKVIRIHPEPDGTYSIPEGNLFPPGTGKTRPEIYTMGHRNPFRISVDSENGYLYWGDVGPDASKADSLRGPMAYDEIGQARGPGNFGWPYFVGNNQAYFKYDYETGKSLYRWDPKSPRNTSPNNTGLEELPPALPAFIWYPYDETGEFPMMGAGGRTAMAGPVYRAGRFSDAERPFPAYYDGKLFIYEWMRGWIKVVGMNEEGDYLTMDTFMPSHTFSNPMDMEFAPNGDLYLLEYGGGWFLQNEDARLVRIEYNGGNRQPQIALKANKKGGKAPFSLELSAEGTQDPDGDALAFSWTVTGAEGYRETREGMNPSFTLLNNGIYQVELAVDDSHGGRVTRTMEVTVGNEPPIVEFDLSRPNRTYFVPGETLNYAVRVRDEEDGVLGSGIDPSQVAVTLDYQPLGFDQIQIAQGHRSADEAVRAHPGRVLMDGSDCFACHKMEEKSIGPSYQEVSRKYQDDPEAVEYLSGKIISGGGGVWGETAMAAHPQFGPSESRLMAEYIMELASDDKEKPGLPTQGQFSMDLPEGDTGRGYYVLRAAYRDRGAGAIAPIGSEETLILKNARIHPFDFDTYYAVVKFEFENDEEPYAIVSSTDSYVSLSDVDLHGVAGIDLFAVGTRGGYVEVRRDGPEGPLLGEPVYVKPWTEIPARQRDNRKWRLTIDRKELITGESSDIYLVFKGEDIKGENLMILFGAEFVLEEGSPSVP